MVNPVTIGIVVGVGIIVAVCLLTRLTETLMWYRFRVRQKGYTYTGKFCTVCGRPEVTHIVLVGYLEDTGEPTYGSYGSCLDH